MDERGVGAGAVAKTLALLFGLRAKVKRRAYVGWGLGLAALKFAIDTSIVRGFTGKTWSPLGYVIPSVTLRGHEVGAAPEAMHVLLAVFAIPFLWVGLTMSVRRAVDAGRSPWTGTLFLVPLVNYVTILYLACLPSSGSNARWSPPPASPFRTPAPAEGPPSSVAVPIPSSTRAVLLALLASIGTGLSMLWISVIGLGVYGAALFFVTPFAMGAVCGSLLNRGGPRTLQNTVGIALVGTLLAGSITLLFAIEGVMCLAMAAPIALVISAIGAALGRAIVLGSAPPRVTAPLTMLLLPGLAFGEANLARPSLRDVTTSIDIAAPPERVWQNVVGFSELPPPPEWFFRLGVAYPQRARIEGEGVGAVRRCEFSTGAFVEPITVWDPPRRLAFDVTEQPPSMTEWSPYHDVRPAHLEGYMTSKGGEFRLYRLPDGGTRLEGTTHYTLAIYPEGYWVVYAEGLLHAIHHRVLTHIQRLSEAG
jgi:uncharacterized membrane protein YhaH (DUF805 family)